MIRTGFASRKITPPLGVALAGYGLKPERRAASVHDDLFARAVVFDDGQTPAALVTCDIISLSRATGELIRDMRRASLLISRR